MNSLLPRDLRPAELSAPSLRVSNSLRSTFRIGGLLATDSLALLAAVVISHILRVNLPAPFFGLPALSLSDRLKLFPIYLIIQLLLFSQFKLYGQGELRRDNRSIVAAMASGIVVLFVGACLYHTHMPTHPSYIVLLWALGSLMVILSRQVIDRLVGLLHLSGLATTRAVIVGESAHGVGYFEAIKRADHRLVGFVSPSGWSQGSGHLYLGNLSQLESVIEHFGLHEVIVTDHLGPEKMLKIHDTCVTKGAALRIVAPALEGINNPMVLHTINRLPVIDVVQPRLRLSQLAFKRVFDMTATAIGLILISPLMLAIALAIKLDSPGPVFFRQQRVSIKGRRFWMYKFRSMRIDAEAQLDKIIHLNERKDNLMFKMKDDPRITRVGKFLRRTSLDELPQLFNVLRGEMSLVGPRPPLPREVEHYAPHHRQRLEVLPGLTGLWQVSGRSQITDFEDVVRLDLTYIRNWSLWLDFKILLKTLPAVIRSEGAC